MPRGFGGLLYLLRHVRQCSRTVEHLDSCVIRFVQDEEPSEHVERSIELEDRPNIGIYRISEAAMMEIEEAIAFNV